MIRELFVFAYLTYVKIFFSLFSLFPQKKKTVFVSSFGDNVMFVFEKVINLADDQIVILQVPGTKGTFTPDARTKVLYFDMFRRPLTFLRGIYHLATCRVVFIDNYYGFLAATPFGENVICVQLWHANGAVKRFGLKDPSIHFRSRRAYKRFKSVYSRFHRIVAGSEKMAKVFQQAFDVNDDVILRTGVPRTDLFFDDEKKEEMVHRLRQQYPLIKGKQVILYAPTFRDSQLKNYSIQLNIKKLYEALHDQYALLLRLHPAVMNQYENNYPDFVIDGSEYPDVNHLLLIADYLITDYSSIPFEFSLLGKPMIFYAYDLEDYAETRGFWEDYETFVPGPIAKNTDELIHLLKHHSFDPAVIQKFSKEWNEYNDGHASEKLVLAIYNQEEKSAGN